MLSIYDSKLILIYCIVVAAFFGAVMGSFLNCMAYRIAHHESFVKGRSHCPSCGHTLGPLELIPIFSWIFQKGRCKACGEKISIRYPLTEAFFGLVTVLCLLHFDLTIECLRNYIFFCCLFSLSLVDLETMIIPDRFHIVMIVVWAACLYFVPGFTKEALWHGAALLIYGAVMLGVSLMMDKILKKDSLGGGDIKLIAVCALYLGPVNMLFALIGACVIGLVFVLIRRIRKKDGEGKAFPFGPSIALSCGIFCLYGGALADWYLGLLK